MRILKFITCTLVTTIEFRILRWAGHITRIGEYKRAFRIPYRFTGKRPPGRLKRRRVDNIRINIKQTDVSTRNWTDSLQDRNFFRSLGNFILNFRSL